MKINDDAKLDLEEAPDMHIGTTIDVTDPYMKQNAERTLFLLNQLKAAKATVDELEQELEGLKSLFWARLHEIMPVTAKYNKRAARNLSHIVITGKQRCGCKVISGGEMPDEVKQAIKKILGGETDDE